MRIGRLTLVVLGFLSMASEVRLQEAAELSPPERRRRLEYYVSIINLTGVAAVYADLKGMKDESVQLRKNMTQMEEKVKALVALMKQEGQNAFVDDTLRPTDRMTTFDNQTLEKIGKDQSIALLGTFVAKVKGGSRARVAVVRDGAIEEFTIRFDERPKDLQSIVQVVGLIPGQDVVAAPAAPQPAAPEAKPVEPPKPAAPAAEPKAKEPAAAAKKAAVPEAAALKETEKLMREIFKEDYARKGASDRLGLAKKLLQQGLQSKEDGAECFLLLREAKDLATQFGDLATALQAIAEIERRFDVSEGEMTTATLAALTKTAKTSEEFLSLARAFLALVEKAVAVENYDLAERSAAAGAAAARKGKDIPLVSKLETRAKEAADLKGKIERIRKAKEALSKNPEDGDANLAIGQYLCLLRGDWAAGLPHLAKGSDAALKAAAVRDLANPADSAEQTAVGDGWWDLLAKENGAARENLRLRAVHWYEKALPQLAGLNRVRIEKRVEDGNPKGAPDPSVDLLKLIDPKDSIGGEWAVVGQALRSPDGAACRVMIPYAPGDSEYDLTVVVQPKAGTGNFEIGLAHAGRQFVVDLDGSPTSDLSGLHMIDGQGSHSNETTRKGRVLTKPVCAIVCSVRRSGVTVTVDGLKIIDYRGAYSRLDLAPMFKVPNPEVLFLAAWKSQLTITKVALRTVSGQGKLLR